MHKILIDPFSPAIFKGNTIMKAEALACAVQIAAQQNTTLPVLSSFGARREIFALIYASQKMPRKICKNFTARILISLSIIFCIGCNVASATSTSHYKYTNLFRQMFERAFFLKNAGTAFYFPFQTPMCRRLSDNKKGVETSKDNDINNFIIYLSYVRESIGDKNKLVDNFKNFLREATCDPFYIDLTEQALSDDRKTIQYFITYYGEIVLKNVQDSLSKLEEPESKLSQLDLHRDIMDVLYKSRNFESRDAVSETSAWSALGVEKIWVEKTQCDSIFNECTSIVNVRVANIVADIDE